jgi:thioredoxin 2
MLIDRPIALNDETFARTIAESDLPVVVDFYADWCGPCKIMAPAVDQLAADNQGKLLVAKLDTDRSPRTAQSFDIRGIPTVIVFQGGKEARRSSGAMPAQALRQLAGV